MREFVWFIHLKFYINPLIMVGFQGMDEDKGPQIRKLYVEVGHAHFHCLSSLLCTCSLSVVLACKYILFFSAGMIASNLVGSQDSRVKHKMRPNIKLGLKKMDSK